MTSSVRHPQVDSILDDDIRKRIIAGQYRPTRNDRVLFADENISDVWKQPPDGHLHIVVRLPGGMDHLSE